LLPISLVGSWESDVGDLDEKHVNDEVTVEIGVVVTRLVLIMALYSFKEVFMVVCVDES
jgi:hypothetical protein